MLILQPCHLGDKSFVWCRHVKNLHMTVSVHVCWSLWPNVPSEKPKALHFDSPEKKRTDIPSLKLTARPWKWTILSFWDVNAYFQTRTVSFREGSHPPSIALNEAYFDLLQGLFRSSGRDTGDAEDIDLLAETDLYRCLPRGFNGGWRNDVMLHHLLVQHLLASGIITLI